MKNHGAGLRFYNYAEHDYEKVQNTWPKLKGATNFHWASLNATQSGCDCTEQRATDLQRHPASSSGSYDTAKLQRHLAVSISLFFLHRSHCKNYACTVQFKGERSKLTLVNLG